MMSFVIAVIVAGGRGTRLWPLSTSEKPKHLLNVTGERSLLQDACERAKLVSDDIYIVTDESHSDLVKEQARDHVPEENIIIEPGRRGTAGCIVLALAHIAQKHGEDEPVAFFHADHHIQNKQGFAETVKFAAKCSIDYDSIALIGIHPDYPAIGFGYIKVGERLDGAFKVDEFVEKPDQKTAEEYLESGEYLWNLGLFAATLKIFQREFALHNKPYAKGLKLLTENISKSKGIKKDYLGFENEAIDVALIEKTNKTVVVPGTFDWMDIGTYKDLHEAMPKSDEFANTIQGIAHLIDTKNSMVISHDKPVAVIGLYDVVVIDTEEGLLVCHKDYAQNVKEAVKLIEEAKS